MLPLSRDRTYADGDHVARSDLMSFNDVLIAMYARGWTQERLLVMSAIEGSSSGFAPASGGGYRLASGANIIAWPLRMPVGRRVRELTIQVWQDGASVLSFAWGRWQLDPVPTDTVDTLDSTTGPGVLGSYQTLTLTLAYPYHRIEAGYGYSILLASGQANDRVTGLAVAFDRP